MWYISPTEGPFLLYLPSVGLEMKGEHSDFTPTPEQGDLIFSIFSMRSLLDFLSPSTLQSRLKFVADCEISRSGNRD